MELTCEYCYIKLKSKSSLNKHIKSSNYCIGIRTFRHKYNLELKNQEHIIQNQNNIISDLNTQLQQKDNNIQQIYTELNNIKKNIKDLDHTIREKEHIIREKENTINDKNAQIKQLQDNIQTLALESIKRPSTVNTTLNKNNNNTINNLQNITIDILQKTSDNLTLQHILSGAEGYADCAFKNSLDGRLICKDYARNILAYKNEKGEVIKDPDGVNIVQQLCKAITEKNCNIIRNEFEDIQEAIEKYGEKTYTSVIADRVDIKNLGEGKTTGLKKSLINRQNIFRNKVVKKLKNQVVCSIK